MIPPMQPVRSSNVQTVGYDYDNAILFICYQTGKLYRYEGVPRTTAEAITKADRDASIGRLLNTLVKGVYVYSEACPACGASLARPHDCQQIQKGIACP